MAQETVSNLLQPQDFSRALENAMYVFKEGNHDKLPDLLQDAGHLLMKASKKLSPTQLVLAVAAVAVVTIFVVSKIEDVVESHQEGA
ncbi:MAG: hypothetical protein ACO1O1_06565 [Adhaeribacter sp.]